jgi:hypothetical protein
MNIFPYVALIGLVLLSCASSVKETRQEEPVVETGLNGFDESFEPMSLQDDDIVIERRESVPRVKPANDVVVKKTTPDSAATFQEVDGFRIQLLATRNIEAATITQQKATEQFGPLNYKTYLIFEAPFYKIRVGDLTERAEADKIRDRAKEYGFDQAFTVRSRVNVPVGEY